MDPLFLLMTQQAMAIFSIIQGFIRDGVENRRQRNAELESLPQEFGSIPWRQVYRQPSGPKIFTCPMEHWDASELSFGGAGNLWCFTWLLRCGRNITRKTDDGRTWESRSGRERKNGYPSRILVNRLVLSGKPFDMIELTLDGKMPNVALCKIRRTQQGNIVSAGSLQDSSNVNVVSTGASTSQAGESAGGQEETTGMEIDPLVKAPLQARSPRDSSNANIVSTGASPSQEGEEARNQEGTMDFQLVEPPHQGGVPYWRRDYFNYKGAASTLRDVANRLEIIEEPESTRPDKFNSTQQMGAAGLEQCASDDDYVDEWELVNWDGAYGA